MFKISAIIPVLNRPKNIKPFIESFNLNTPLDKVEIFFIANNNCKEEIEEINKYKTKHINVIIAPDHIVSWATKINYGIDYSNSASTFSEVTEWVLCGADDIVFHSNWVDEAEIASIGFDGIIGTNDLGHSATISGSHTTHPIVSRNYVKQGTIDQPNKFCHEGYIHNYVDAEFVHTAYKRGTWKHAPKCIIEHKHPAWNKNIWDDIYQKGQNGIDHDRNLWLKRKLKFSL